ncbi:MAG: hypothetical protein HFF18_07990 [Oscillospiraceae bacterium]|nr:hypothetical protein [Oscillospiraceae bacterium]
MKRKGLLCAILALVLLFSAQPAAVAAGNVRSTIIRTTCRLPVIKVTVPTSASVYINPLRFPVSIGDEEADEQIISTPAAIANMSEVPVAVDVTVAGAVKTGSTMTLASAPTGGSGTEKSAFVYFEIKQADSEYPEDVQWDPSYDAAEHIAVISGVPITRQNIMTLPARTLDGEVAEGGYAPFRLTGDAVKKPTNAWNSRDGINVSVAFTFTPLSYS